MSGKFKFKKFNDGKTPLNNLIIYIMPVLFFFAGIFFYEKIDAKAEILPQIENTLTINALGKKYKFCYPEIDRYDGKIYLKNAEDVVDGIYYDTLIEPKNATVKFFPEREYPFEFEKESFGCGIDKKDLLAKIDNALNKNIKEISCLEVKVSPLITLDKLKKSTYRRAFFTTNFPYSSEDRKSNIALSAKYIGGKMLIENEEFSFNEVVGARTEERGFKGAKIIENGKFVDGVGGGVCQVSSTVYNAVLLGGLKVTERHNHSMLVSYVEPSFDAMVSGDYADLKFVNDTGAIVFILAKVDSSSITISVYGEKPKYTYKRVFERIETISPPDPIRVPTCDLLIGEEKVSVYPKDGGVSIGYLEVYSGEKLIDKNILSKDKYKPLQGEIYYGEELSKIPKPLNNRLIGQF